MKQAVMFNKLEGRYEMDVGGLIVYANTRKNGNTLFIDYVEAPHELRGTGAAGKFMEGLMKIVRDENLKVTPLCGYAATWLQRHNEHKDLLSSKS